MLTLVSEHGAIDALLSRSGALIDAVINELSPHKDCIGNAGAQDEFVSRPDEQAALTAIGVLVGTVVPQVHVEAIKVAIESHPPRLHASAGGILQFSGPHSDCAFCPHWHGCAIGWCGAAANGAITRAISVSASSSDIHAAG